MKESLRRILAIQIKELKTYFYSPIAYVVIAVFLVVSAWFFFNDFFIRDSADMRRFFGLLPWIFTFIIPAITMGSYAEEHSRGSYEMLVTLPLSSAEIVVGKYVAASNFLKLMIIPALFYAFCIEIVGDLEWGPVIGGFLGAFFLAGAYAAIGLFASSVTKNQIIAFIVSVLCCFFLTSIDGFLFFLPKSMLAIFQYISANYHFQSASKGIIDTRDFLYFSGLIFIFLVLTQRSMQHKYNK